MAAQDSSAGVPLNDSKREITPGYRDVGPADPQQRVEVSLLVRRPPGAPALAAARDAAQLGHLSRAEFAARHGASGDDIAAVTSFAADQGLQVVETSEPRRTVVLAGTVAQLNRAFGVDLRRYEGPGGSHRGRTGVVHVPANLAGIVEAVFGLDDRPQARPFYRSIGDLAAAQRSGQLKAMDPPAVGALYDFPAGLDGSGVTIAVIELGGGFDPADLAIYFNHIGITPPDVTAVGVDGATNAPTTPQSDDQEVALDIEVIGALAPGAKQVVYFAPNTTDRGFLDAVTTAVHDAVNTPSIVSISWGGAESGWTQQAMTALDNAFADAATLGVTVLCASGDSGSSNGVNDGLAHATFPASSPHVLACGGTRLEGNGGTIMSETVWNDPGDGATGGGISDVFDLPDYQQNAGVPESANPPHTRRGRGVPDVAGDADPATGYNVRIDGQPNVVGGTSAVAPLWAALVARINQHNGGAIGFLNPLLYALPPAQRAQALHDIVKGNNGAYKAGPGWDACTGLGSPDGAALLAALPVRAPA